jgi:hypothetical protein
VFPYSIFTYCLFTYLRIVNLRELKKHEIAVDYRVKNWIFLCNVNGFSLCLHYSSMTIEFAFYFHNAMKSAINCVSEKEAFCENNWSRLNYLGVTHLTRFFISSIYKYCSLKTWQMTIGNVGSLCCECLPLLYTSGRVKNVLSASTRSFLGLIQRPAREAD